MSTRSKWSREELEAARGRVRGALKEPAAQPISLGFRGEAAKPAAPPRPDVPAGPALRAAAVLSRFRLDDLRTTDAAEMSRLKEQSIPLREEGWRTLPPELRNEVLRGLPPDELRALLEQHERNDDPLQAALRKARHGLTRNALQAMSIGELAALLQIWEGVFLHHPLFSRELVERKLQLARLLDPLRQITRTFSGRAAEMQQLRDYVGVLSTGSWVSDAKRAVGDFLFKPVPKGPFLIHGPGGVGKTTLTAQFILEHALAAEQQRFPFAYLDFDRPAVNAEEPVTILIEAIRQIGLQYDSAFAASERLGARWRARLASGADTESFVRDFIGFLETLEVREGPVLFVLDTFEEVQRRSNEYARGVTLLTGRLSVMIPRLRVVIAGRSPLDDGTYLTGQLPLEAFDRESAVAYLRNSGLDPASAELVAERTRGNPLTLTLAIELYRRDPAELRQLDAARLTDEIIQSSLFDRILLHIPDPEVRRLAHPGLVLRRVTPELIRDVLAKPCGVDASDLPAAEKLFDKLAADSTLVTHVDPRTLVHRSDVRRLMLKPLREHQPEKVEEIHRAAIAFYRQGTDVISRAEAAYHALSLGEPVELSPDLEPLLVNALDELAPEAQVQLAEAYRLELPPGTWTTAGQEAWERVTARKVAELLQGTDAARALELLREREQRGGHTDLLILESRVHLMLQDVENARAVARRGIATYRDAGSGTLLFRMLLMAAEIERRSNAFAAADSFLADAEEIARRRDDALMLAAALARRADVEMSVEQSVSPHLIDDMAEATSRLSDDVLARDKLLLQRVVSHVATAHPPIASRAARLGALELTPIDLGVLAPGARSYEVEEILATAPTPELLISLEMVLQERFQTPAARRGTAPGTSKNIRLKTAQREQLRDLLVTHYGDDLASFVETRYSRGLESISFAGDAPRSAMDLVRASEREGWLNDLIIGLWRSRFTSLDVLTFIDAIGLGPRIEVANDQHAVSEKRLRALLTEYRASIGALEMRTCMIDADGKQTGCGVLVGRGTILTAATALTGAEQGYTFDSVALSGREIDGGARILVPPRTRDVTGTYSALVHFNASLVDSPVDGVRAAPGAPLRGAAILGKAQIDPNAPIFWLWRTAAGTFLSGVEHASSMQLQDRFISDLSSTSPRTGAPCFDSALNLVGVLPDLGS